MNKEAFGRFAVGATVPEGNQTGKIYDRGTTVPTDATAGYATGCLFIDTTGGAGVTLYVNEGSVTSCDFNAVSMA